MQVSLLHKLLLSAIQQGASDIHLQVGYPPLVRINGELRDVKYHALAKSETQAVVEEILSHTLGKDSLQDLTELDTSYSLEGQGRFRVNIFRQRGSFGIVLRIIPIAIPVFADLNLPRIIEEITNLRRGLILVVGATGNGKSTSLAAMIEHININRRSHIITIEDPIEFLFRHKKSVISQREVGTDTPSFSAATVAAMRQDPDVIFIGEMRETETVDVALKAAETGHLVLSSLHTTDATKTLARLLGFYTPEQEAGVRMRLADSLRAVVALRLMAHKGLHARIPAVEVLRVTRTIQECIRNPAKTAEIPEHMVKGAELYGMQTFDLHLLDLVKEGKVDLEVAKLASSNPDDLARNLMMEGG